MEQDDFQKLFSEIEQRLRERYWLIPRDRAMLLIGACSVFFLFTIGSTWLAVKTAVSGTAAAEATRRIQANEDEAQTTTREIQRIFASLRDSDNLARINERIVIHSNNVISIEFPNNNGRFQIEESGKTLWYDQPVSSGNKQIIHDNFR